MFSSVSTSSRGRECGPYLHHLGAFGGVVIVGAFVVVAVVTTTRMYIKNRREGGEPFVVEALTEIVCGDDVLGDVEATVLFSGETRGSASRPRSPDSWTVQKGCETEFECRRSLPGQDRRWCGSGESKSLEGSCDLGRRIGAEPERERAARGCHRARCSPPKGRMERGKTAWRRLSSFSMVSTLKTSTHPR